MIKITSKWLAKSFIFGLHLSPVVPLSSLQWRSKRTSILTNWSLTGDFSGQIGKPDCGSRIESVTSAQSATAKCDPLKASAEATEATNIDLEMTEASRESSEEFSITVNSAGLTGAESATTLAHTAAMVATAKSNTVAESANPDVDNGYAP